MTIARQAQLAAAIAATAIAVTLLFAQKPQRSQDGPDVATTVVLGRPTGASITISVMNRSATSAMIDYGTAAGVYTAHTDPVNLLAGTPTEITLTGLAPNTRYFYRLELGKKPSAEESFMTQRAPGSTFTFAVQGDSHPERQGKMFDPILYLQTLRRVHAEHPDFDIMLGDDFSIEGLIGRGDISQAGVNSVYAGQRAYLTSMTAATPLFLVNGNHEEAGGFLLDGTDHNPAVYAGRARAAYFPLPAPDSFYTGDAEPVAPIGLLRDYYAWTWGDALFVVIDPYWHCKVDVDEPPGGQHANGGGGQGGGGQGGGHGASGKGAGQGSGGGKGNRDLWDVTLGDAQYQWLRKTLEGSHARYKFVFEHHILGTGRGGVEEAGSFEWGGQDRRGVDEFKQRRPGWELPVHQLFVKSNVTIYFQGHDHLFAHQQKDGVTYQETPNPADNTYTAFNSDAYRSGDILPNAGHLLVTVSPTDVRVDYIRSWLAADAGPQHKDGEHAFTYTIATKGSR
jgi:hypothetical protein